MTPRATGMEIGTPPFAVLCSLLLLLSLSKPLSSLLSVLSLDPLLSLSKPPLSLSELSLLEEPPPTPGGVRTNKERDCEV